MRHGGLDGHEDSPDVYRDHPVEVREAVVVDPAANENSRIVDQNVEAAERIDRLSDGALYRFSVGAVCLDRQDLSANGFDFRGKHLRTIFRDAISESDGSALACQSPHNSGADST